MTTARQKILSYLDKSRTASAREISRSLKMSTATVRHHLRVLVSDGRLERVSGRERDSRGRPENVYSLPSTTLGDNFAVLGDALLAEAASRIPVETLAEHLAERLAEEPILASQSLARRLNLAVEKLNQMKYHARWEAGSAGPRLIFGHCPYAAIIERHPELCRMDEAILRQWMGQSATQVSKAGNEGSSVCVFAMEH